jgi:hypothetical protein
MVAEISIFMYLTRFVWAHAEVSLRLLAVYISKQGLQNPQLLVLNNRKCCDPAPSKR